MGQEGCGAQPGNTHGENIPTSSLQLGSEHVGTGKTWLGGESPQDVPSQCHGTPHVTGTRSAAPRAGAQLGCDSHPTLTPPLPSFISLGAPTHWALPAAPRDPQGNPQHQLHVPCQVPEVPTTLCPSCPPHQPGSPQTPQPRLAPFAGCCKDTIITSNSCLSLLS